MDDEGEEEVVAWFTRVSSHSFEGLAVRFAAHYLAAARVSSLDTLIPGRCGRTENHGGVVPNGEQQLLHYP
jgi:hypothetical protein